MFKKFQILTLAWLMLCLGNLAFAQTDLVKGEVLRQTYDFTQANRPDMEYALYLPTRYDPDTASPLVILLHGLGSNPQQVINYAGIIENAEQHGYIVAAPYGYNQRGWYGSRGQGNTGAPRPADQNAPRVGGSAEQDPDNLGELSEQDVMNVLALMQEQFNIDTKRIYLMGHSMGGGGTLHLGFKYPQLWAALAPLAPAIWSSPDQLEQIRTMPIILVQGESDNLVTIKMTRPWAAKLATLDMNHRYLEIPRGDHVASFARNPEMIAEVFAFFNINSKP